MWAVNKVLIEILLAAAFVLSVATAIHAGSGVMKTADGKKVRVNCSGSGCVTIFYDKAGKRVNKVKGPGGRPNYLKQVKMLKRKGYK